jgi:hypothetical protein
MKRKLAALLLGALLVLSTAGAVWADGNDPANPGPATTGYEGQPGNQAGPPGDAAPPPDPAPPPPPGDLAPGLLGYEGQPGNQGG